MIIFCVYNALFLIFFMQANSLATEFSEEYIDQGE